MTQRQQHLLAFLLYSFVACLITFPLILQLGTHSIGGDNSDTYEMVRHTWWIPYAIQNGQDIFWQSHLAYPDGFNAFSFQANLLQYFPPAILGFILPPVLALNLTVLITLALNGWALYYALRHILPTSHISLNLASALLGGLVFMAAPTFQGHLFDGHTGLIVMYPVPFFLLALHRFLNHSGWHWRRFAWAVFWFWLSPSGHMLQIIYVLLPIMGVYWLSALWHQNWQRLMRVTTLGVAGGIVTLVYLAPMIAETYAQADTYLETTYVRYSMDALAIVSPSFLHPLWGTWLDYPARVLGVNLGEGSSYIGIVSALLMLIAVVRVPQARFWALVWSVAFVLALGPLLKIFDEPVRLAFGDYATHLTLPLALVQNLPGFNVARTPARFNFTMALAGAIMLAYGVQWLLTRYPALSTSSRRLLVVCSLISALYLADVQHFFPMPSRPAPQPRAIIDLRHDETLRAVFNVPHDNLLASKDALYYQTLHQKPLIAGQVTRQTPASPARLALLESTLNPALLGNAGADAVIVHKSRAGAHAADLMMRARQQLGAPAYEDDTIALFIVTQSALTSNTLVHTPPITTTPHTFSVDFYAPQATWAHLTADVSAQGRNVVLRLNGDVLHRWFIDGQTRLDVMLPVTAPNFYRAEIALDPPCPARYDDATLACLDLTIHQADLTLQEEPLANPIAYAGVDLRATTQPRWQSGEITVSLWWHMQQPITTNAIRFVHILDANGTLVAQDDRHIGTFQPGDQWAETVHIPLSNPPTGDYHVVVGWYDFDTLTRWRVLDDTLIGAENDAPQIGIITIAP